MLPAKLELIEREMLASWVRSLVQIGLRDGEAGALPLERTRQAMASLVLTTPGQARSAVNRAASLSRCSPDYGGDSLGCAGGPKSPLSTGS